MTARTLSDSALPPAQPGPSGNTSSPTPTLDVISEAMQVEEGGETGTLKDILKMHVHLLELMTEHN